jgi:hypothetical protein
MDRFRIKWKGSDELKLDSMLNLHDEAKNEIACWIQWVKSEVLWRLD